MAEGQGDQANSEFDKDGGFIAKEGVGIRGDGWMENHQEERPRRIPAEDRPAA